MATRAQNHHYSPQGYRRGWSQDGNTVSAYRILVPSSEYPEWERRSLRSLAQHTDLYTTVHSGTESDEVERWLNEEIEVPAAEPLAKVRSGKALTDTDWENLARYVGSLHVRTPASLSERLERWKKELPELLDSTMQKVKDRIANPGCISIDDALPEPSPVQHPLPLRVSVEPTETSGVSALRADLTIGRELWLHEIRQLLTSTVDVLTKHEWRIMQPASGLSWFTSDNPLVRLNWYGEEGYDLRGGWGRDKTDLFIPLSPDHLMYTQVSVDLPGGILPLDITQKFQSMIAENAHRWIFATSPKRRVAWFRPRVVDRDAFVTEEQAWDRWHEEQRDAPAP